MEYNFDEAKHGELSHYGVKGMHWGVRKSVTQHPDYSSSQRDYDRRKRGSGAVHRINGRMNKGLDLTTARKNETKYRRRRSNVLTLTALGSHYHKEIGMGAKVAGTLVGLAAGVVVQSVAKKAETNRGRASAAASMGLPRHATNGPTYAKKSKGAYKISSL